MIWNTRENRWAIVVFIGVRLVVTGVLFWLTSGEEVASDTRFHRMLIDDPLGILSGRADISIASYPPLQFLIEWPLFHFFLLLTPEFIAFRLMFSLIELCSFLIILRMLSQLELSKGVEWVMRWGFALGPHQLLTSVVFEQEEVISQLFIVTACLLLIEKRKTLAIVCLGAGVVMGKIFLILPLFYLTVFYQRSWQDLWGWILMIGVYSLNVVWALSNDGNPPFLGFTPNPEYGSHFWVAIVDRYPEHLALHKNISLLTCVIGQMLLCAYYLKQSSYLGKSLNPMPLITMPLALFFFTFYQHMPEYLLLFWPAILIVCNGFFGAMFVSAVIVSSWAPNLFFGLKNIGIINSSKSPTRNRVLQPVVDWLGVDFVMLHWWSTLVYSALYIVMLAFVWQWSKTGLTQSVTQLRKAKLITKL